MKIYFFISVIYVNKVYYTNDFFIISPLHAVNCSIAESLYSGWQILFSGTNEAVFISGNLDSLGVCVKVTDVNAYYTNLDFYENIPVPLQGMNADNYEIYVMYQDGFYDTQQTFAIN